MRSTVATWVVLFLAILSAGCTSTFREGGREAAAGAFAEADAWWERKRPEIAAEAAKLGADAVLRLTDTVKSHISAETGKTDAKFDGLKDSVKAELKAFAVETGDRLESRINVKLEDQQRRLEEKIARGEATPQDYLLYMLLASGLASAGVATGKGIIRKALGLKIPVERIEPPKTNPT